ncbi:MAG: DUF4922 domain-containing protein [Ignavibacteriales bacterium]|nr:DUF4922 domain-containing protein [Ignavibacteriales bacterium]
MISSEKPGKNNHKDWWADKTKKLLEDQKNSWEVLRENYKNLSKTETKIFGFGNFEVKVQCNPERIKSTGADVSRDALNSRPCFLCGENLPAEQDGLLYNKKYLILANPYPIFDEHFTITKTKHSPQTIIGNFEDMLDLSEELGRDYSLFYNGPKCGASAPDHMHFQAAQKNIIPVEYEADTVKEKLSTQTFGTPKIKLFFIENFLRCVMIMESSNKGELLYGFKILINALKKISLPKEEPMLNIISTYNNQLRRVFIFPRLLHRPKQFFENGEKKILVSPAAVDMGGLIILPREEDFNKINPNDIIDIYRQVSVTKEFWEYLKKKMGDVYL